MTTALRRFFVVVVPLALAAVLWYHPDGGPDIFEDIHNDVAPWIVVHTAMLFGFPLLVFSTLFLLTGIQSRAATVSRVALVPFLAFYTAWETTIGIGNGVLVDYANDLPPDEQAVVSDAIQHYSYNSIVGAESVAIVIGALGWVVAMVAASIALKRAGAGWTAFILIWLSSVFVLHPPPIGPAALVCFAAGAVLVERWRKRTLDAAPAPESRELSPATAAP